MQLSTGKGPAFRRRSRYELSRETRAWARRVRARSPRARSGSPRASGSPKCKPRPRPPKGHSRACPRQDPQWSHRSERFAGPDRPSGRFVTRGHSRCLLLGAGAKRCSPPAGFERRGSWSPLDCLGGRAVRECARGCARTCACAGASVHSRVRANRDGGDVEHAAPSFGPSGNLPCPVASRDGTVPCCSRTVLCPLSFDPAEPNSSP